MSKLAKHTELPKYHCYKHPGRVGIVEIHEKIMCWECYIGRVPFINRYGADFYEQADTVWLIHNPDDKCVYCTNKEIKCDQCKDFKYYSYKK